jgi:hypothetical protein
MTGESLANICRDESMPGEATVYQWLASDHQEFVEQYARARETQAERYAEEIIALADDKDQDVETKGLSIERNKVQIDARKWVASKLLPKKYGTHKSVEFKGEVENKATDLSHLSFEQLYELKHGRKPE